MRNIVRIDMAKLSSSTKPLPRELALLGGRGLTSKIVQAEVPATCNPLRSHNKLVIACGQLAGTGASTAGRLSVGAKSPLTGTIKESNAGGEAGNALGRLGIAAVVIENVPEGDAWHVIKISKNGVELLPGDELAGLGNYATVEKLFAEHGEKVAIISIGNAGEMRLCAASVAVTDTDRRPTRHAGRGGMGAVMGSKRVKAIVLDPEGCSRPESADTDALRAAIKVFARELKDDAVTGTLCNLGTNGLANIVNAAGAFPTRNFREGQFEGIDGISGETQRETIVERGGVPEHGCHRGCTIRCSRVYVDKDGNYVTKGPEFETIWAHGADCGIDNLDDIAYMDRTEDDIGIDTIETGSTLAVAMEAGIIAFGDGKGARGLVEEVRKGTPMGRLVGSGAHTLARVYGVTRCPTVKRQAMPAYDPRGAKGMGVTYATGTMGADHTSGYMVAYNILKVGGDIDALGVEGQVEGSRSMQQFTAAWDTAGLCLFCTFMTAVSQTGMQAAVDMINAHLGSHLTVESFLDLGADILKTEREFNEAAGFTEKDDRLPEFMTEEALPPHNQVFDIPAEELDKVHVYQEALKVAL